MQHVEAEQGHGPDHVPAQEQELEALPNDGGVGRDVGPHRNGPEGELVPGEQIAGEGQGESKQEEGHPHHPVELARGFVGAGPEHPAHVEEDDEDHGVGGPAVHVP